jgi:hypothetical protein
MSSELPGPESNHHSVQPNPDIVLASVVENGVADEVRSDDPSLRRHDPIVNVGSDELSHLHPMSLIFDLLAHGKTYLVPAAFGVWGAANGDMKYLIISALIFIPAFLTSVFRYFTLRYSIDNGQLIVRQGLIFRNVRTVPVSRIQNIDFVQNPLHRMIKVA